MGLPRSPTSHARPLGPLGLTFDDIVNENRQWCICTEDLAHYAIVSKPPEKNVLPTYYTNSDSLQSQTGTVGVDATVLAPGKSPMICGLPLSCGLFTKRITFEQCDPPTPICVTNDYRIQGYTLSASHNNVYNCQQCEEILERCKIIEENPVNSPTTSLVKSFTLGTIVTDLFSEWMNQVHPFEAIALETMSYEKTDYSCVPDSGCISIDLTSGDVCIIFDKQLKPICPALIVTYIVQSSVQHNTDTDAIAVATVRTPQQSVISNCNEEKNLKYAGKVRTSNNYMCPKTEYCWEKDDNATQCSLCPTSFTYSTRKHHCRLCGKIICSECSLYMTLYYAQYSTDGKKKRVCKTCGFSTQNQKKTEQREVDDVLRKLQPMPSGDNENEDNENEERIKKLHPSLREERIEEINRSMLSVMEDFKHCGELVTGAREFIETITHNVENAEQRAKKARKNVALAESYQRGGCDEGR